MASVSRALERIKQDLEPHLPPRMIEAACRDAGHEWRERKLGPVRTVHLFVLQVLHLNTAIRHLRHLAGHAVNAAAYCEARARLPLSVLQGLLRRSAASMRDSMYDAPRDAPRNAPRDAPRDPTRWRGHRTLLVDACGSIAPDTPSVAKVFRQPSGQKKGCGLPVPKVLGLFDAMTGLLMEVMAFSLYVREGAKAWLLHPLLAAGDLLVGDRDFCSYAQLASLSARGVFALFRVGHGSDRRLPSAPQALRAERGGDAARRGAAGNAGGRGAGGCVAWAGTTRSCGGSNPGPLTVRPG